MENFSDRLSKAMKERRINATQLSENTGIDKGSISHYLSGKYKAKQDKVFSLAEALRVDPAWLMGHDVPMVNEQFNRMVAYKDYFEDMVKQSKTQKVVHAYWDADDRTRKAIDTLLGITEGE